MNSTALAFPEWVDPDPGKPWTVRIGSSARIDLDGKVLELQEGDPPGIVAHELAHLLWSPPGRSVADKDKYVDAVEDCRINLWLGRVVGLDAYEGLGDVIVEVLSGLVSRKQFADAVLVAVSIPCGGGIPVDGLPRSAARLIDLATSLLAPSEGRPAPFRRVLEVAAILRAAFDESPGDLLRKAALVVRRSPTPDKPDGKATTEAPGEPAASIGDLLAKSGTMATLDPPKPLDRRRVALRRPSDTGAVPRRFDRFMVDRAVFRAMKRDYRRGTVLIDASASMKLTHQQIAEFARMFPYGTIAYYGGPGGEEGTLVIAAREGRAIEKLHDVGVGNIVDVPALLWLVEQPEPRHWITDTHFSGKRDYMFGPNAADRVVELAKTHRVIFSDSLNSFRAEHGRAGFRAAEVVAR